MARQYVDSTSFVAAYLRTHRDGGNMQSLADSLGMNKASATVRASQLRQAGVNLPKLAQSRKKLDIAALAKMVENYEMDLDGNHNVTISDHLDEDIDEDGDTVYV